MELIKSANIGIRFLLELCVLVIGGYWGSRTGENALTKILLGGGIPLLFALVWGMFLAPKSATRLPDPWLFLLEIVIFGLAVGALYSTGKTSLAITFGVVYLFNKLLMILWSQL
ncbi:MAG: YrdB family protein [Caldilineaceae bacterium]|nr:YrdB family protein [Caldilineaceae bacterium]